MSHGSGYTAASLTWLLADHGGVTLQKPALPSTGAPATSALLCGASTTIQLSVTVRPMLTPPWSSPRCAKRALKDASTPLYTSLRFPKSADGATRLSTWPNFDGLTSYNPQSWFPPPPGSRGSTGAVMQNGSKFASVTARLSVLVKPPNEVR